MKKIVVGLIAAFIFVPMTASADLIGTGTMTVTGSGSAVSVAFPLINNGYSVNALLDYQTTSTTFGSFTAATGYTDLQLDTTEVYCVEGAVLQSGVQNYQFYSYENSLESYYTSGIWEAVTWLANYGLSNNPSKELVQKTIWELLGIGDVINWNYITSVDSTAYAAFLSATDKDAYVDDWLLAVTPLGSLGTIAASQNYFVKATATTDPVPEPTTMLLFGTGLAGLAGIARRRRS